MVRDPPKQHSDKNKGPPPPVPKKPKNPFCKDVAHAIDKPRPYSELLQKNIKMGRRELALLSEDFGKSLQDLDMAFCPGTLDLPSYICTNEGFDAGSQLVDFPAICSDLGNEDKNLWTNTVDTDPETKRMDLSQINHILEKKAKMKGPPPPVPKKPLNPFSVATKRHAAIPDNVSISEDDAGVLTYENYDYKPYMQEGEVKTIFDADNFLNIYSNSNTLDDLFFLRYRPDLIDQTVTAHEKRIEESSRATAGKLCNKVLERTKMSFSRQMEGKLSPKKGKSIL